MGNQLSKSQAGFLAAILAGVSIAPGHAETLQFVTEENPPQNMLRDGKIIGAVADQVIASAKLAGLDYHISIMPWARALQLAQKLPNYCVFATARTVARERFFTWIGPLTTTQWMIYTAVDTPLPADLASIRGEIIAAYNGDVLSLWLSDHGFRVDNSTDDMLNPSKLVAGRVRYWASSRARASNLIIQQKLEARIIPALSFGSADLYLACNRATAPKSIADINMALNTLRSDGTLRRIIQRYSYAN